MDYAFVHDGRAYTPNQTAVEASEADARNHAIEVAELARWAERPDRQLAYYDEKLGIVTTWPGTPIGRIMRWRIYRHNLGGRFISLRVRGSNGASYYGRASYDNGSYVWLRKAKRGK